MTDHFEMGPTHWTKKREKTVSIAPHSYRSDTNTSVDMDTININISVYLPIPTMYWARTKAIVTFFLPEAEGNDA